MKTRSALQATSILAVLALAGCGQKAGLDDPKIAYGANPALTKPDKSFLIPTVKVAEAIGWQAGETPTAAAGLQVQAFAEGLNHPRWLYRLPNGDILLAESNAPPKSAASGPPPKLSLFEKIKNAVRKKVMAKAGAGTPSPDHIILLRDADGDGRAEQRSVLLSGLRSPFGMALIGDHLYVGNTDAVDRYPFKPGQTTITAPAETVVKIPGGGGHYARNIIASADGTKLYVTVGSATNIADGGIEAEKDRAAILEVDIAAKRYTVFASGLRNPNGLAWHPTSGALWTTVNERDELGADLVPDYMTAVKRGAFYGWPYSYYGQNVDDRVKPQRPDLVAAAVKPDYALGAHTAALGLAFSSGASLPAQYDGGAFVAQHGSWNREPAAGYRVIFIPFQGGAPGPNALPQDVLTGFLNAEGKARGRPVAVIEDRTGALLVTDDAGNKIWRVSATAPRTPAEAAPARPPAG